MPVWLAMTGSTGFRGGTMVKAHAFPCAGIMALITLGRCGDVSIGFVMTCTAWFRQIAMIKCCRIPVNSIVAGITLRSRCYMISGF